MRNVFGFLAIAFVLNAFSFGQAAAAFSCQNSRNETADAVSSKNDSTVAQEKESGRLSDEEEKPIKQDGSAEKAVTPDMKTATFGGGCFWCVEAVFVRLKGVEKVRSGFMGGSEVNPTYKQVLTGMTGHAEVVQIEYDANQISYEELLEVFWKTHDPTTLNRQGNDVGTQYRSVIFFHDEHQKELADTYKKKLNEEKVFTRPVVTEIAKAGEFYIAEDYHQDFYKNNPSNAYCRAVIPQKLQKLNRVFKDKLKTESKSRDAKKSESKK